jgi:hypothetical protein
MSTKILVCCLLLPLNLGTAVFSKTLVPTYVFLEKKNIVIHAAFEVLTTMAMKSTVYGVVTPCISDIAQCLKH